MKPVVRLLCLALCAALLLPCAAVCAEQAAFSFETDFSQESLGEAIERYLESRGIRGKFFSVGWRDLTSGEEWYRGADLFMEGASTYKLPLCMLYADRVAAGEIAREDKIGAYTVETAVRDALVISSNNAADALRRGVSENHVEYRTAIAASCSLPLEELPSGYYTANQFSPRCLIGTLQTLWDGREGKYDWIVAYMTEAQPESFISRWRGEYEVAHKTGNALGYISDTGVVFAERPFLLTVMTYGLDDAETVIAGIARIAMDYAEYLAAQPEPAADRLPEPVPENRAEGERT
ncbi:MAG: serine hydrolase [Oscillospiraceae bacterium]|nr:serine hydrolase [Oscillospiraceae bacterium]